MDFNVYRKDGFYVPNLSGRGVLVAVHANFDSSVVSIPNTEDTDLLCVQINYNRSTIFVLCCYIRPNSQAESYQLLLNAVDFLFNIMGINDNLFVVGDFNLPFLSWTSSDDNTHFVATNARSLKETLFVDNMLNSGLFQISNIKNNLNRQLDLVFCSDANNSTAVESRLILSSIDLYHPPILITFCFKPGGVNINAETSYRFNYRRADFQKLNQLLTEIDFDTILNNDTNNIENQTENFYSAIFNCIEQSVPLIRQRNISPSPPWYTKELRALRNLRNKHWRIFLKTKSEFDYSKYLNVYNEFCNMSQELYSNYILLMQTDIIADPKRFWQFINSKKKSDGYPSTLRFGDHSFDDPKTIAHQFANYFSQAFSNYDFEPDEDYFNYMNNIVQSSMVSVNIDYDTVANKIIKLQEDFSFGPDGLPPIVLKKCINSLALPIAVLFQNSLSAGIFPSIWKDSFIVPVHKKGCKSDVCNYRPIAKLSCVPKLFESVVYESLYFHCRSLISDTQHGFLRGRSTTTNLTEFTSNTLNFIEAGRDVDVITTDFSKAFDRVSHKMIIFKMKVLGFPQQFVHWVESYLVERRYQVKFRSCTSYPFTATSGVPQGSHLGPIFFILCINDVEHVIKKSTISVYADDMKIYKAISTIEDVYMLQDDLRSFVTWCGKNNLELNSNKCQFITYSRKRVQSLSRDYYINNEPVTRVSSIRDLGVIFDNEINFRNQFDSIINRSNSMLGFVKRWSKEFHDPRVTKALYTTFVRPLLEYASQVWSPYHDVHINRIEGVQRRFTRFALRGSLSVDGFNLLSYLDRLKLMDMQPLSKRRAVADVIFIQQILSGNIDSPALLNKIHFNVNSRILRMAPAFNHH